MSKWIHVSEVNSKLEQNRGPNMWNNCWRNRKWSKVRQFTLLVGLILLDYRVQWQGNVQMFSCISKDWSEGVMKEITKCTRMQCI